MPPRLSLNLGSQVVALLQLLEVATGVGFCCHCCHPRPCCLCMGASQLASPTLWSQIVQQAPGYGVTSSPRGATDPRTTMGGMPEYGVPPRGLTPMDFSIWSIPPQEVPPPPGLPTSQQYQPPMGRASSLRAAIDRQAQVLRAAVLQAPLLQLLLLWAPLLQPSWMAPPLHQPLPSSGSRPATPYQQVVPPPSKPRGREVTFDSSTDKPVAAGGQDADDHGRQRTPGRDDNTQPASHSRGAHVGSSVGMTSKQTLPQEREHPSGAPHGVSAVSRLRSTSHPHGSGA